MQNLCRYVWETIGWGHSCHGTPISTDHVNHFRWPRVICKVCFVSVTGNLCTANISRNRVCRQGHVVSVVTWIMLRTVMLVLVLALKDSLRTKMQSLSWSLSLTMQSLSLSLLLKSWSLNKSPWSCPCDCVQNCIHIKIRIKVTPSPPPSFTPNSITATYYIIISPTHSYPDFNTPKTLSLVQ